MGWIFNLVYFYHWICIGKDLLPNLSEGAKPYMHVLQFATNAHLPFWQFSSFHLRYGEGKWAIILSNKRDTFEDRTAVLIVSAYFYFIWFSLSDLMTSYFMNRCIWRISGEIWPGISFVLHFARSPWLHGMSFYHIAHYGWKPHICR